MAEFFQDVKRKLEDLLVNGALYHKQNYDKAKEAIDESLAEIKPEGWDGILIANYAQKVKQKVSQLQEKEEECWSEGKDSFSNFILYENPIEMGNILSFIGKLEETHKLANNFAEAHASLGFDPAQIFRLAEAEELKTQIIELAPEVEVEEPASTTSFDPAAHKDEIKLYSANGTPLEIAESFKEQGYTLKPEDYVQIYALARPGDCSRSFRGSAGAPKELADLIYYLRNEEGLKFVELEAYLKNNNIKLASGSVHKYGNNPYNDLRAGESSSESEGLEIVTEESVQEPETPQTPEDLGYEGEITGRYEPDGVIEPNIEIEEDMEQITGVLDFGDGPSEQEDPDSEEYVDDFGTAAPPGIYEGESKDETASQLIRINYEAINVWVERAKYLGIMRLDKNQLSMIVESQEDLENLNDVFSAVKSHVIENNSDLEMGFYVEGSFADGVYIKKKQW